MKLQRLFNLLTYELRCRLLYFVTILVTLSMNCERVETTSPLVKFLLRLLSSSLCKSALLKIQSAAARSLYNPSTLGQSSERNNVFKSINNALRKKSS